MTLPWSHKAVREGSFFSRERQPLDVALVALVIGIEGAAACRESMAIGAPNPRQGCTERQARHEEWHSLPLQPAETEGVLAGKLEEDSQYQQVCQPPKDSEDSKESRLVPRNLPLEVDQAGKRHDDNRQQNLRELEIERCRSIARIHEDLNSKVVQRPPCGVIHHEAHHGSSENVRKAPHDGRKDPDITG